MRVRQQRPSCNIYQKRREAKTKQIAASSISGSQTGQNKEKQGKTRNSAENAGQRQKTKMKRRGGHGNHRSRGNRQSFAGHAAQSISTGKKNITGTAGAKAGKTPSSAKHVTEKNQISKRYRRLMRAAFGLSLSRPRRPQ